MYLNGRKIGSILGKHQWKTFMKITKPREPRKHGIMYESDAIQMYKTLSGNNNVTIDKKIYTHNEYKYIRGQVDGIVNLDDGTKAILEVKCPCSKKFDPTIFKVTDLYWVQIQIYMEIFDIPVTHYCEYHRFDDNNCFGRWKVIYRDKPWFSNLAQHMDKLQDIVLNN